MLVLPDFTFLFFFCASVLLMGQPALGVRNTKPRTWKIIALFCVCRFAPGLKQRVALDSEGVDQLLASLGSCISMVAD